MYLSGFSMGANDVLTTLSHLGADTIEKHGGVGAVVTGAPFDLTKCAL